MKHILIFPLLCVCCLILSCTSSITPLLSDEYARVDTLSITQAGNDIILAEPILNFINIYDEKPVLLDSTETMKLKNSALSSVTSALTTYGYKPVIEYDTGQYSALIIPQRNDTICKVFDNLFLGRPAEIDDLLNSALSSLDNRLVLFQYLFVKAATHDYVNRNFVIGDLNVAKSTSTLRGLLIDPIAKKIVWQNQVFFRRAAKPGDMKKAVNALLSNIPNKEGVLK